jgi:hypothetical protein
MRRTGLAPPAGASEQHTSLYMGSVKPTEVRRYTGSDTERLLRRRVGRVGFKAEAGTTQSAPLLGPELGPEPALGLGPARELGPASLGHGGPLLVALPPVHSPASSWVVVAVLALIPWHR